MKQQVKNIIFDLGGVLVGLDKHRCISAFEQIGAEAVAEYVRDHRTADLFYDIEVGQMTTADFCKEVRTMAVCNASDEEIVWAWNQLLTGIPQMKKERLLALKPSYRLFLLSNTNEMHWKKCVTDDFTDAHMTENSYFEQIFLSYKMNLTKPNRQIFERVLNAAGIEAAETLFIDDSLTNCQSAVQLGIQVFHETTGNDWLNKQEWDEDNLFG